MRGLQPDHGGTALVTPKTARTPTGQACLGNEGFQQGVHKGDLRRPTAAKTPQNGGQLGLQISNF